jgi:hypothetical protein
VAAPFDVVKLAQALRDSALRDRAGFSQANTEPAKFFR